MPTVTLTTPAETSQRVVISPNRESALFGRSSKCDVKIDCESVSAQHATLRRLREGYVLRDMGSTNGTKLDGKKVSEIHLKRGQNIQLGDVTFLFEPDQGGDKQGPEAQTDVLRTMDVPKPASRRAPENNPLVFGLALLGGGLILLGIVVLVGTDAILAIAERDEEFIYGGGGLIAIGLLCLASILLATGSIRLPKLVLAFPEGTKEGDRDKKKKKKDEEEDDKVEASRKEEEDDDDAELGNAPKAEGEPEEELVGKN